jgi:hypothetical protein
VEAAVIVTGAPDDESPGGAGVGLQDAIATSAAASGAAVVLVRTMRRFMASLRCEPLRDPRRPRPARARGIVAARARSSRVPTHGLRVAGRTHALRRGVSERRRVARALHPQAQQESTKER